VVKTIEFVETDAYAASSFVTNNQKQTINHMTKNISKITVLSLFATALVVMPVLSRAEVTNAPAATNQTTQPKPKKHENMVFNGIVIAVNTNAMTLTVSKRTFDITSATKITKNGQPATLSGVAVGDKVGIAYKKAADGKLTAMTVNDGKKPADEK
jgi:Domain of unknown function (DUF5666)